MILSSGTCCKKRDCRIFRVKDCDVFLILHTPISLKMLNFALTKSTNHEKIITPTFLILGYVGYANAAEPATIVAPATNAVNNYLLYPATNIYTFLKLDTRNGKIWQVQYSMDDNEFELVLNSRELVTTGKPGQFALYHTTNNWTFLLHTKSKFLLKIS